MIFGIYYEYNEYHNLLSFFTLQIREKAKPIQGGRTETYMKVLLINGSPHKDGCTNRALNEVMETL